VTAYMHFAECAICCRPSIMYLVYMTKVSSNGFPECGIKQRWDGENKPFSSFSIYETISQMVSNMATNY